MSNAQVSDTVPDEAQLHARSATAALSLGQRIDRIHAASRRAWKGGQDTLSECKAALDIEGHVDRNPYAMVVAALGSGYVMGGGVFTPLTAKLVGMGLRLGLRFAAIPLVRRELLACTGSATANAMGS